MTELSSLPVHELRAALKGRRCSALEVTEAFLAQIDRGANLNAFITVSAESARAEARVADARIAAGDDGALLGIPVAVKDMILTRGVRTTAASRMLENFVPPYDATVVTKLKEAGAIIVGKTNLDEFAMGSSNENSAFGPVRNPWHTDYVPGGSSGGSAAAVAARLAPISLGTDTGGSIRQPASFCGIVGIKPTYGRVSRYGVIAYASSLDQVGPFAANVRDCALAYDVLAGHDARDSTAVRRNDGAVTPRLTGSVKGLRIGIPKEYFIAGLAPAVESAVRGAVATLEQLGASVVEVSLPHTELAVAVYYVLAPAEASSNLARYDGVRYGHRAADVTDLRSLYCRSRSEGFGAEIRRRILVGTYVLSAGYYDAYYLRAQKVRTLIKQDFEQAFASHCDIIACPTAPTPPFKLGEKVDDPLAMYLSDVFTIPVNLAGLPGLSVPCGFEQGLPIGLQLIGRPWEEETLFNAALALETATEWHRQQPGRGR